MATKTVNASEASYDVLAQVRKDAEEDLHISVSLSDAIKLSAAAYFELKKLKQERKGVSVNKKLNIDLGTHYE